MPIHDAYARRTPYELLLPDADFAARHFAAVEAEAAERGSDLSDPEQFVMLMAVGETLRELRGAGESSERIREHGWLLFHAHHFREAGRPLWLLSTPAARLLVEGAEGAPPEVEPPGPAGYVQLPQHLFWARSEPERPMADGGEGAEPPPQPVDGFFWTAAGGKLSVLAVLGVREDRPGFSVVPLPPLPVDDAPGWAADDMREGGGDFRSDMPGAELESLYEIRTAGELLKLVARAFGAIATGAAPPRPGPGPADGDPDGTVGPDGPAPSALAYRRITLD
ncbi:MAG: hypothetical protein PVI57_04080 [Gemmatimonadota bacterium]|jgi:hypothetical protein